MSRVLVVEDEEGLRRLLMAILEEQGYQVEVAGDGDEGLRRATQGTAPDLLILDVMLPGRSGFAILEALRKDPTRAAVPVVMLTGKREPTYRQYGTALGADAYLTKPFEMPDLVREVKRLLRRGTEGQG